MVELYLSAPSAKLDKPAAELKGFAKTGLLQPGKSETVVFKLEPMDLASFDTAASAWIAESGKYTIAIGASSINIKQSISFQLANNLVVEKVHNVMAPLVPIQELKNNKSHG